MCFSAGASFTAGILLSGIGIASLKKAKEPSQVAFAAIPVIFGVQQITEGFLWLSFVNPGLEPLQATCTYLFLFFAQIVWPFWVPFSIFILQSKEKRKLAGRVLVLIGTMVSLYLAYCLVNFPVQASADNYHIAYRQDYPASLSRYGGIFYIIATIVPPFFSPYKYMWSLGAAILVSYIMTAVFYEDYIVSVWCFFASIISVSVLVVMYYFPQQTKAAQEIRA